MLTPLHAGLEEHFKALEAFLAAQEAVFEPEVRPMVRDVLAHPGKRLRPLLAFGSGAGGAPSEALVRGAGIIELVHLATLVHDDVLDGADTRHGSDTPNRTHGAHAPV